MPIRSIHDATLCATLLLVAFLCPALSQDAPIPQLSPGSARKPVASTPNLPAPPQTVGLTVPKGTPLPVALDQEIRVRKVGQPVHALVVEPVYAFDQIVIPVGSEVIGQVTKIDAISGGKPTVAAPEADFTPAARWKSVSPHWWLPAGNISLCRPA